MAFLLKPIQRYLVWFHNQSQVTCIPSKETKKTLKGLGVQSELIIIPNGVDTAKFSPKFRSEVLRREWQATEKTRVILFVGRLSPEKEIDVIIHAYMAMKKCQEYPSKLVIVGDGPDQKRLKDLSHRTDIIFTGALSGHKLAEAYASSDVFAFPSQVETFGNVVLEAMASGLPVIAYDTACAHLHIQHMLTGWLIPLQDKSAFAQAIQHIPSQIILEQMGKNARSAVEHLGWEYSVKQFETVLYRQCGRLNMAI